MTHLVVGGRRLSDAPVLVTGCHRSGTTLVARLLAAGGVFMGADLDTNHESASFVRASDWLLSLHGMTWAGAREGPTAPPAREAERQSIAETLHRGMAGVPGLQFLGARAVLTVSGSPGSWGWKDPRLSFTWPYWLMLAPNAQVIVVERDGRAVADSLVRRHERRLTQGGSQLRRLSWYLRQRKGAPGGPSATRDHLAALRLWARYVDSARAILSQHPGSVIVKYEELVATPAAVLEEISALVRGHHGHLHISRALASVQVRRASGSGPSSSWLTEEGRRLLGERGYGY